MATKTRLDTANAVQEVIRHNNNRSKKHTEAQRSCKRYMTDARTAGNVSKNGVDPDIQVYTDLDYVRIKDDWQSMSSTALLCDS